MTLPYGKFAMYIRSAALAVKSGFRPHSTPAPAGHPLPGRGDFGLRPRNDMKFYEFHAGGSMTLPYGTLSNFTVGTPLPGCPQIRKAATTDTRGRVSLRHDISLQKSLRP